MYQGIGVSKGIGIGKVVKIIEADFNFQEFLETEIEPELKRLHMAISKVTSNITDVVEEVRLNVGEAEAMILQGQIVMLVDPSLISEIETRIRNRETAESAVTKAFDQFIALFSSIKDELIGQRVVDLRDLKTRLLCVLLGKKELEVKELPKGSILLVHELTPSMAASIDKECVEGIVAEVGGNTSHSAIMARVLRIPAVFGIKGALSLVKEKEKVIVDGFDGLLIANPNQDQEVAYLRKAYQLHEERTLSRMYFGKKTATKDGINIDLFGNIGSCKDVERVIKSDGEGVGLFRTEFLFMDQTALPSEEEQLKSYQSVLVALKGKPVTIRTFDIGGDKDFPPLGLEKEENPFLGYRSIRYCLEQKNFLKTQLRAMLRASVYGKLKIMIPFITCIEEVRKVKELIKECEEELTANSIPYTPNIPMGIMIETPAACLMADLLAKEVDFFSIGTNDLVQYTMAADRGNPKVSYLYSALQPAVLRSIQHIIECAKKENIPVGMCGEAASDFRLIPLLLSFGLDEFSVSPECILETRNIISNIDSKKAKQLRAKVMQVSTLSEVLKLVSSVSYK